MRDPVLSVAERAFLADARRAVLATIGPDGRPRLVPICQVVEPIAPIVWTPLDEKPKAIEELRRLARVRDIARDPRVIVLVDRWDEDWGHLAWVRCQGSAFLVEPGEEPASRGPAIAALRAKYPQYAAHDLASRPIIRIALERTRSWGQLSLG